MIRYLFLMCVVFTQSWECIAQTQIYFHKPNYKCIINYEGGQDALDVYLTEKELIKSYPEKVSITEELETGVEIKRYLSDKNLVIKPNIQLWDVYKNKITLIQSIMKRFQTLNQWRIKKYELVFIDVDEANAFTSGGVIFITKGLMNLVESPSQWAFIIAHEMGHNELKHIHYLLKRQKGFGGLGSILLAAQQTFMPSFNQFEEWEADVFACDVLKFAKYNLNDAIEFFNLLNEKDNNHNEEDEFLRKILSSHPLHEERYECLKKHIGEMR